MSVAQSSLSRPFTLTAASYLAGWVGYDARLRPPPAREVKLARPHYYLSANVLKASEDKTFPGAIVASLASPWGQSVPAGTTAGGEPSYFGSYREVFSRDLYEAFTGLLADGDLATARAAALFLFDRQQLPDGAMPRNSLLNGKAAPDTGGTQLDETAYPILMAYLAGLGGDATLWQDHIRPAADFLVANGPVRRRRALGGADRLLPVHDRGRDRRADRRRPPSPPSHGDAARARLYQATADDFQRNIKSWTVTTTGPDGPRYFIRLSKTGDPNAAISYSLGNGGPTVDQRAVIDGGFQELVRLGELPGQRPRRAGLAGRAGQADLGVHAQRHRLLPVRQRGRRGQRGRVRRLLPAQPDLVHHHRRAVAAHRHRHRAPVAGPVRRARRVRHRRRADRRGAAALLHAMLNFSSGVGLVPEQAWEDPDLPASPVRQRPGDRVDRVHRRQGGRLGVPADLGPGPGTAADRLALGTGRNVDTPAITTARYVTHGPPGALPVTITAPAQRQHAGRDLHHRDRDAPRRARR